MPEPESPGPWADVETASAGVGALSYVPRIDRAAWSGFRLATGVLAPADGAQAHALIASEPDRYIDHVFGEFVDRLANRVEERGRVQGMNDMFVFGCVTVASLSSGGLMNCIGGDPVQGWTAVNLAMLPFLTLAGSALIWLVMRSRRAV